MMPLGSDNNSDSCLSSLSPHNTKGWACWLVRLSRADNGEARWFIVSPPGPEDNYAKLPSLYSTHSFIDQHLHKPG